MTNETLDQDAARERIAIEVEHHEPAYAQVIYNKRVAEMESNETEENKNENNTRKQRNTRIGYDHRRG